MKRAHRTSSTIFLVKTHKVKVTGENQEVETEIRSYTLTKIQTFLKDLVQQEEGSWLGIVGFWNRLWTDTHGC